MNEEQSLEAVRNVYKRACTIHLPKKPYIHMAWAAFEERHGTYYFYEDYSGLNKGY